MFRTTTYTTFDAPNTDLSSSVMEITPEMAARWLEGNVRNRKVDQKHVDRLAAEIKAGRWKVTHQGLAFDTGGTLQDGQHRLWAILQADRPVRMMVTFNVPPDSIDVVDGGKGRTVVDRMNLGGTFGPEGVDHHDLATLREMVRGLVWTGTLPYYRQTQLMAVHRDAIDFAMAHVGGNVRGVSVCYVRAVVARAWYAVDLNRLATFCRVLTSGMPNGQEDAIVIRLRDQLMAASPLRSQSAQREMYGKVERALLAWLNREDRKVLRPVQREHFPLPEEAEPIKREPSARMMCHA